MSELKSFKIVYDVLNDSGNIIKSGKIRVKNKYTKLHAQSSLEDFLKKKVNNFHRLIIHRCDEESFIDYLLKGFQ